MVGWTQSMLVGLYGHYGQYGLYGRYGSYGPIGLYGVYGAYGRRRGAQLTNFLFVRICILVFEHHVRRVFSWFYVSLSRFFSRSLLESAPCRGASHSSLCSQLRRSLCSQLRSSQCRALRSGVFVFFFSRARDWKGTKKRLRPSKRPQTVKEHPKTRLTCKHIRSVFAD